MIQNINDRPAHITKYSNKATRMLIIIPVPCTVMSKKSNKLYYFIGMSRSPKHLRWSFVTTDEFSVRVSKK